MQKKLGQSSGESTGIYEKYILNIYKHIAKLKYTYKKGTDMEKIEKVGSIAIKDTVKALDQEEVLEAIKVVSDDILWDELMRRDNECLEKINYIEEILGTSLDNLHPIPASAWEDMRTRYNDLRDKFSKIRKGFTK